MHTHVRATRQQSTYVAWLPTTNHVPLMLVTSAKRTAEHFHLPAEPAKHVCSSSIDNHPQPTSNYWTLKRIESRRCEVCHQEKLFVCVCVDHRAGICA